MTILFKKQYDGESMIDMPDDIYYALEECDVPQDEYGIQTGTFTVTIEWSPEEMENDDE